jgi:hypothetical protein
LEFLEIKGQFNHRLDNLPNTLKTLIICSWPIYSKFYDHPLDYLPESLECLWIGNGWKISYNLPTKLKELYLDGHIEGFEVGHEKGCREGLIKGCMVG